MSEKDLLKNLKSVDFKNCTASLAVVKEYKKERVSHYGLKYVQIDSKLEKKLIGIISRQVEESNVVEEYTFDCPDPEGDLVRTIGYEETDFLSIYNDLLKLNPEEDIVKDEDDLIKAKAYLIVIRNDENIEVVGFKVNPENWKMKKSKGLIPLMFRDNRFEDLDSDQVFSISKKIDFIYFDKYS